MKTKQDVEKDLASIREVMERSTKFISLSGISGVLAGIYALAGAGIAYFLVYYPSSPFGFRFRYVNEKETVLYLLLTATGVLAASLLTGFFLSSKKAAKHNQKIWNKTSKNLMKNLAAPLIAGGLFILILVARGYFIIVAPSSLLFYGLALVSAANYTYGDVKYLGYCEIALGLCCALLPGYGLLFWATGFGLMHIIYGTLMHLKYDR